MGGVGSIVVAVLVAACSAVAAALVADRAVIWLRVSQVEGNAGFMAIGFGLIGLVGGFLLGLLVCRWLGAGFLPSLALSLGIAAVAIGAGGGLAWLNRDEEPSLGDRPLAIAFEIRLGPGITLAADDPHRLYVHFAADGARAVEATLQFPASKPGGDAAEVTGRVTIHTRRTNPHLSAIGNSLGGKSVQFDIRLPPPPETSDWSDWLAPRASDVTAGDPALAAIRLRYRVVAAE